MPHMFLTGTPTSYDIAPRSYDHMDLYKLDYCGNINIIKDNNLKVKVK